VLDWNDQRLPVLDRDIDAIVRTHARGRNVAAWLDDTAHAFEERLSDRPNATVRRFGSAVDSDRGAIAKLNDPLAQPREADRSPARRRLVSTTCRRQRRSTAVLDQAVYTSIKRSTPR
jgi:hypothetical protein